MPSHIRIFPHSRTEFPSEDSLTMWLLTSLRGRGGVYLLGRADAVSDLPPGCLVLFRYGQKIVGEAIVCKEKEVFPQVVNDRTLRGEAAQYGAQVTFSPSSVRLYAPSLPVECIQPHAEQNLIAYAGAYVKLDWGIYPRILEEVIKRGILIS